MDAYATHLPVLKAIPTQYTIRRVLEFGSGHYSTPLFLDTLYYPDLLTLVSYETDQGWYESVSHAFGDDKRLVMLHADRPLEEISRELDFRYEQFDLIFVDNGAKVSERIKLLEELNQMQPSPLVIVHDFDVREYQHAMRDFPLKIVYTEYLPHTALLISKNCPYLSKWRVI